MRTMGYAFISYSSQNKSSADAIKNLFAKNHIDTWMAPNDIPVGSKYAQVINRALKDCACLVLLLTNASQNSMWVAKEVERAINYKKVIIPIQLEELVLHEEFEFYISTDQLVVVNKIEESSTEFRNILRSVSACVSRDDNKPNAAVAPQTAKPAAQSGTVFAKEEKPCDPWECYRLGYACEFGVDRPVDYREAVKWYLKAAEQGHAWSQNRLGDCYANGHGVAKDPGMAVKWYTLSAGNGDKTAQYNLANCYFNGTGVTANRAIAFELYRESAYQGVSNAQYCVAYCYEFGQGVSTDYAQAAFWYEKAAQQGHSWAQHRLGECYFYGRGVSRDYYQAFHWLKLSADQNNKGAYYLLAECYAKGLGVGKNEQLANHWRSTML